MSVFEITDNDRNYTNNRTQAKAFFGPPFAVARYDSVKYPQIDALTERQMGYFWRPQEINLQKDRADFRELTEGQQFIFTSNLKRQIMLDSIQGRAPVEAFLPVCTLPELEAWILTWSFFEQIHSRSYTHIIRNIYANPSEVLDGVTDIAPIVECAKDISFLYDGLIEANVNRFTDHVSAMSYSEDHHKRALWFALNAVNALEGIRFYVSFACSWAFAELKMMEGNAKIIKLIARDENLHLGVTQQLLRILPKEDPFFENMNRDYKEYVSEQIFRPVAEQEKTWARFAFTKGSMIGLNAEYLIQYIEWLTNKRMAAIGLPGIYPDAPKSNPLPWTEKWIRGENVQIAPQEAEKSEYVVSQSDNNVGMDSFKDFKL